MYAEEVELDTATDLAPDISLILPAFNEAKTIVNTVREAHGYFQSRQLTSQIIVSADGDDGTRDFEIEDFDVLVRQSPAVADLHGVCLAGQWVLVTPGTLAQQKELVEMLREAGAFVALDTELHYLTEPDALAHLRDLTRLVDCFLPSLEHIRHLFDAGITADPAGLRAAVDFFGCPLTIVKCGGAGAVVFGPDDPQGVVVPAVANLEVKDPTGAGDAFNGGCLVGLARGEGPSAAAVTGCVAASFVVQAIGAEVSEIFSSRERTARYEQCYGAGAPMTERQERV